MKSKYPATRHPFLMGKGHWEGDVDERGETHDVWVRHCDRHEDHEMRPDCSACRAREGERPNE